MFISRKIKECLDLIIFLTLDKDTCQQRRRLIVKCILLFTTVAYNIIISVSGCMMGRQTHLITLNGLYGHPIYVKLTCSTETMVSMFQFV